MIMESRVAKKYGTALFALAQSRGIAQSVWNDLVVLGDILREDPQLMRIWAAPQIPDQDKQNLARDLLANAEPTVMNSVLFVIDKRRTADLPGIIAFYGRLLDESQGVVEATITSAVPLQDDEVQRILAHLATLTGKRVRHELVVDPTILGGVVIIVGGEIIDHSVRHDLTRLRDALQALKVHAAA
ncbi:MAG: ATP synthase F1 subunit delta [Candidatus Zixiibacteriota bacterium]